jgi:hypothetical protein
VLKRPDIDGTFKIHITHCNKDMDVCISSNTKVCERQTGQDRSIVHPKKGAYSFWAWKDQQCTCEGEKKEEENCYPVSRAVMTFTHDDTSAKQKNRDVSNSGRGELQPYHQLALLLFRLSLLSVPLLLFLLGLGVFSLYRWCRRNQIKREEE